jgi:hypothetical protein
LTILIDGFSYRPNGKEAETRGRGGAKGALVVAAREALVLGRRRLGASATDLARLTGLNIACISRRHDAAIRRAKVDDSFRDVVTKVTENYQE